MKSSKISLKIDLIDHLHLAVVFKLNYQISVPYERRHTPLENIKDKKD